MEERRRHTYLLKTIRQAICLWAGGMSGSEIEKQLGIETEGIVDTWRNRERGGKWEEIRAWVESEEEDEEAGKPFTLGEEMRLRKRDVEVAGLLLDKCERALRGEIVEFVVGVKPTARNVIEGVQRAHIIINKDASVLRELEESVRDERELEEAQIQQILRRILRAVGLSSEQLEEIRKEFPGLLPVVSEIMPRRLPAGGV